MFSSIQSVNIDFSNWDVTTVTSMENLFAPQKVLHPKFKKETHFKIYKNLFKDSFEYLIITPEEAILTNNFPFYTNKNYDMSLTISRANVKAKMDFEKIYEGSNAFENIVKDLFPEEFL